MAERSLGVRISANVTGLVAGLKTAERATLDLTKNAIQMGDKYGAQLDSIANKAALVGAGLLAVAGFAVKAAMDWETAWAGVTKTVDGTPGQLAKIEAGIRSMSTELPSSAEELAAIAESAGALGVKTEDILGFTRVMADLGQTTNLTSDEAATSIAQLMNVMQTAPGDVDNLGAALVDLGNKGASTERQIIQMAQNIAGAGSIVGLSEAQVLGLANALASSGIEAEAGGSAISNVLIGIAKAVDTGSPKLEKFAEVAGTTADEFARKWEADPAEALTGFVEGLGDLNATGGDVFSTLDQLGLSDIRVTRALLNMASSGDMLRNSLRDGESAWAQNTALAEEAGKRYDTTAAQTKMAWNEIKSAAVDAGQGLLPVVSSIASGVGDLAAAFGSLPSGVQGGITSLAAISGIALLAGAGLIKLITTTASLKKSLDLISVTSPRFASNLGAIGKNGAIAAATLAAISISANAFSKDSAASVEQYTEAILKLGEGGKKATADLDDLINVRFANDSLSNLISDLDVNGFREGLNGALGVIGLNKIGAAEESVKAWDSALTSLVKDGKLDEAAAGFKRFTEAADDQGRSLEWSKDLFPGYQTALAATTREQKEATEADKQRGAAMGVTTALTEEQAKALQEAQSATRGHAMAFSDFSAGVDVAKVSLQDWQAELAKSVEAQANWADNLVTAMARGVDEGVISRFEEMGPEGAQLLDQLVNGSQSSIDRMNDIWGDFTGVADYVAEVRNIPEIQEFVTRLSVEGADQSAQKVADLAIKYGILPDQVVSILKSLDYSSAEIKAVMKLLGVVDGKTVSSKVQAETEQARKALNTIISLINSINPFKTVTINTVRTGDDVGNNARAPRRAAGGALVGAGTGTSDSILALVSNGEHVLTAAEVQALGGQDEVYRLRKAIMDGSLPAFASGGAAGKERASLRSEYRTKFRRGDYVGDVSEDLSAAFSAIDELIELSRNKALSRGSRRELASTAAAAEKGMSKLFAQADAIKERLEEAQSIQEGIASSLSSTFDLGALTKPRDDGWVPSAGDYVANAKAKAGEIRAFAEKLERLRKRGISPRILAEIADLGTVDGSVAADAFLAGSKADIKGINAAYKDIDKYASNAGDVVAKAMDLEKAGKNTAGGLSAGFVAGLKDKESDIYRSIRRLARGMEKELKDALGIKSPSTVMRKNAHYTADGFILGIGDRQDAAQKKMREFTSFQAGRPAPVPVGAAVGGGPDAGLMVEQMQAMVASNQALQEQFARVEAGVADVPYVLGQWINNGRTR